MRNIYVIGGAVGYAKWMQGTLVQNMEEADLVVLTGGADINPRLYNEPVNTQTYYSDERDRREVMQVELAIKMGKPIFGTCRGLQLLTALAGGKLIQHMSHPHWHGVQFYDGTVQVTNSLHHQLCNPFNLRDEQFRLVAFAKGLSPMHEDGNGKNVQLPVKFGVTIEPESIFYPELNAFGQQSHLEMLMPDAPIVTATQALLSLQIEGKLYDFITQQQPIKSLTNA